MSNFFSLLDNKLIQTPISTDTNLNDKENNPISSLANFDKTLKRIKEIRMNKLKRATQIRDDSPLHIDSGLSSELNFLKEYLNKENELEDEHLSSEWFRKIAIDELVSFLFSVLSIGNGIIYYEVRTCFQVCDDYEGTRTESIYLMLLMSSISFLLYFFSMIVKYYHYFQLQRCAKYIQSDDNFFQTNLWGSALAEFILAIIHPNLLFKDYIFTTGKAWNLVEVTYHVNDMLIVISLFRMFYWISVLIAQTTFYSARSDRVCKMMGIQQSFMLSFKCILIHHTMEMQSFITLIVITSLGYMLKIIEGALFDLTQDTPHVNNFTNFGSCIWCIFVTITSIGYGDYSAKTLLGRIVTVLVGIVGIILVALNINFFQSQTQLDKGEERALGLIQRLEAKKNLELMAAKYYKISIKYFLTKKKYLRGDIPQDQESKDKLMKYAKKKNRMRKEFNAINHQFSIEYKTSSDVDTIKKKVDELEKHLERTDETNEKIEKALEALLG